MLNANRKLGDVFSADFDDLVNIPQIAAETHDALQPFLFYRLGPRQGIPVPLELEKQEQQTFLKDLCGFLNVRPLLMFVNDPFYFCGDFDDED
jgi:hypothetical protein